MFRLLRFLWMRPSVANVVSTSSYLLGMKQAAMLVDAWRVMISADSFLYFSVHVRYSPHNANGRYQLPSCGNTYEWYSLLLKFLHLYFNYSIPHPMFEDSCLYDVRQRKLSSVIYFFIKGCERDLLLNALVLVSNRLDKEKGCIRTKRS